MSGTAMQNDNPCHDESSCDSAPNGVLTWAKSSKQRNHVLQRWRHAVFSNFGQQARCLRVCWVLSDLFNVEKGYAFVSDPTLSELTSLPRNKTQATLTELERGGAIVRTRVFLDGRRQRRIYPAAAILPPKMGGADTPSKRGYRI
jgi:hypothetical protein